MRVYLCVRADDRRTWPWIYGIEEISGFVVVARGARPSNLARVSKEVRGLESELWFWLGGASDEVIDRVLKSVVARGLLGSLRSLGFTGVLGPDTTVLVGDASADNYVRFSRYLSLLNELRDLCRGCGLKFVPQVKYVYLSDLRSLESRLSSDEVFYNASFELSDGVDVEPVINYLRSRFRVWLGLTGWVRDLELASRLRPDRLVVWRHVVRLQYPRRGRGPKEELERLIIDLRSCGLIS